MASVPEILEALHAALVADTQLTDVDVTDGPVFTDSGALDWIIVGYDGEVADGEFEPGSDAVDVDHTWSSPLSSQPADRIRIANTIVCLNEDEDMKAAREHAYAVFDRVRALVRANPSLGLPQVQAFVDTHRFQQGESLDGMQARIAFILTVDTFGL